MITKAVVDNTLVDYPRLEILRLLLLLVTKREIPGHFAEIGAYKGGTAHLICSMLPIERRVRLFVCDTFTGLPEVSGHDTHHKGDFADTSLQHVDELLSGFQNYSIYQGVFPRENSQYLAHHKFAFVHIDVDIYPSVKECLEFFWPRMSVGGIIVIDDYHAETCPGAKLATDEFCAATGAVVKRTTQCQAKIVKT